MIALRDLLRETGPSEIFALHIHPDLRGEVRRREDYRSYEPHQADPLTIVHVSMGDEGFLPFLDEIPGRFVISYHNVTPSRYFARWDRSTARLLDMGRRYLGDLRPRAVFALADSEYNAADLREAGYTDVRVGGLALDVERLTLTGASRDPEPGGAPVILSVGQLYPHKRPDLLLAAFHRLVTDLRPDARLVLAGAARLPVFESAVSSYVDRLGLSSSVTITREISQADLVAWYRRADLFVTASEHEGFCVPLVEAMFFDVPILGRACGAVPETTGDAGVIVRSDAGPRALSRVMSAMLDAPAAMESLRERARIRRRDFTREACRQRLFEALNGEAECD